MLRAFLIGAIGACLLVPSIAAADDTGWYVGLGAGSTTASEPPGALGVANAFVMSFPAGDPALSMSAPTSLTSTSSEVEGGYWFTDYVAVQLGYLDLGTFSNAVYAQDPHNNICYNCLSPSDYTSNFSDTTKARVRGKLLAMVGRVPLPDEFELLGKVGWFNGSADYHEHVTGLAEFKIDGGYSATFDAIDLGVGLGRRFASHWGVELWWDAFKNTRKYGGNSSPAANSFDVKDVSLDVQYHF